MPIILRESRAAPRLIGTAAAALTLLLSAALVLFAPWQLPRRLEDSWELPIDLEFPEIAQRIFRKIERRAPELDPVRPTPDTSPEVQRAESSTELLQNTEGPQTRSLDDSAQLPTDPTGIDRASSSPPNADIIIPTSATPGTTPQDLTGSDPSSATSAPPPIPSIAPPPPARRAPPPSTLLPAPAQPPP